MKKLYRQFNRLKIDEEFKPVQVSDLEKERVKNNVMKLKQRQLPRNLSVAAIILASLIALSFTISIANPTFAAKLPIIGNIYEFFSDDNEAYVFDDYDHYSTDIGVTKESNGVAVTITDAVYDGESITIAYTMKSEQELGEEPFLDGQFLVEEYKNYYTPGRIQTKKISNHEYAGLYIHYLMEGKKSDEVHVSWDGESIRRSFDLEKPIEGDWSFEFTLDALESKTQEFDNLISEDEGIEVVLLEMTTTPISNTFYFIEKVDKDLKEWEEENWEYVSYDYLITDDLGNEYNVLPNAAYGSSKYYMKSRITTPNFHEKATSVTITPMVHIYKAVDRNDLELVKEPYMLDPIEVPLNKN